MNIKTAIAILTAAAVTMGAYGQGTVTFGNSAGTPVRDGTVAGTPAAAVGSVKVGLYYANGGGEVGSTGNSNVVNATLPVDGLVLHSPSIGLVAPGLFVGGTRTLANTAANSAVAFQVRAWDAAFADYAAAFLGGAKVGASNPMYFKVGGPGLPTPSLVVQGGLQGFTVVPVPEPSTIALGLLGGALLLFRRRK